MGWSFVIFFLFFFLIAQFFVIFKCNRNVKSRCYVPFLNDAYLIFKSLFISENILYILNETLQTVLQIQLPWILSMCLLFMPKVEQTALDWLFEVPRVFSGPVWSFFLHALRFLQPIFTYHIDPMCAPFTLGLEFGGVIIVRGKSVEEFYQAHVVLVFFCLDLGSGPILHPWSLRFPLPKTHTQTQPT